MANITAEAVKELRERTGAGMMDCKNTLVEAGGDIERAIDLLREKGLAKAAKKAGRSASDGRVYAKLADGGKTGVLLELDCETDFVAKTDEFNALANEICDIALKHSPSDVDALLAVSEGGETVNDKIVAGIAKMGENMVLRRFARYHTDGSVHTYIHTNFKVGVMVELGHEGAVSGEDAEHIGHELCMQIAAASPSYIRREEVTQDALDHEREIYRKQAIEEGKEKMADKIADGKINSFYKDNCLLEQPYIRDPKSNVASIIKAGITVKHMSRFAIGE